MFSEPRVALIHYWLVRMRGGERVLERMLSLFPNADIFTHVYDPASVSEIIRSHNVSTTFIQKLPASRQHYQKYLPLMPMALEELDLSRYDLVISCEAGPAKGVITGPDTAHLCYCHSPMRYIWDAYGEYRSSSGAFTRMMMPWLFNNLRTWDAASAARVDSFVANSNFIRRRVQKVYRRESAVVFPPVPVDDFMPTTDVESRYLWVGEMTPYKRADLVVDAFNELGLPLLMIGDGPMARAVRRRAKPNIAFIESRQLRGSAHGVRPLPRPGVHRARGLRHRAGRSSGGRQASPRLRTRRRPGHRQPRRHGPVLRRTDTQIRDRWRTAVRGVAAQFQPGGGGPARAAVRAGAVRRRPDGRSSTSDGVDAPRQPPSRQPGRDLRHGSDRLWRGHRPGRAVVSGQARPLDVRPDDLRVRVRRRGGHQSARRGWLHDLARAPGAGICRAADLDGPADKAARLVGLGRRKPAADRLRALQRDHRLHPAQAVPRRSRRRAPARYGQRTRAWPYRFGVLQPEHHDRGLSDRNGPRRMQRRAARASEGGGWSDRQCP